MNSRRTGDPTETQGVNAWAACWEDVLCLPKRDVVEDILFAEAERLVRACEKRAGSDGIDWFARELDEGELFVMEQIAAEPFDPDWRRVGAVLAGARAAIAAVSAGPGRARNGG